MKYPLFYVKVKPLFMMCMSYESSIYRCQVLTLVNREDCFMSFDKTRQNGDDIIDIMTAS